MPTSNTTYCPNQFFDVCLPHASRGCVRLVAYLIRCTLGWSDARGNPQEERVAVSYSELIEKAHISRDMIRAALNEAVDGHFIRCIRQGTAKAKAQAAQTAVYELQWNEGTEYVKDPKRFRGFFAGDGNRTYIPNQFFDHVIPSETLAVVKVVGSVIRFSIAFQTTYGFRRQHAAISYDDMQRYAKLRDRKTLAAALKTAIANNYIERVEEGRFDPHAGKQSKAATYALKWLNPAAVAAIGRKTPPGIAQAKDRSETPTGIGQKSLPGDRSENPTDIQITGTNNTLKQQKAAAPPLNHQEEYELLRTAGFDEHSAADIAARHPASRIARQLEWLPLRRPSRNRLGMLRKAIEQDWSRPHAPARADEDADSDRSSTAEIKRRRFIADQAAQLSRKLSTDRLTP
jgi:hypothetical protein